MADNNIAQTISNQIGGRAFQMMGARNLIDTGNGLTFKVGRNAKAVTHVRVELTDADLYDVTFLACRGTKVKTKAEAEGIYADQLHAVIERETGLYLSL